MMPPPPSPIEQLVDEATGYKPNTQPPELWKPITCDKCRKHRRVHIANRKPYRILCTACLTNL
jgi:hypothetical protein